MSDSEFIHRFVPGSDPKLPVLLLLHGTGGNENDLISLGRELLPEAPALSPRGQVLENGMPRFFRRFAEGVFDVDDLKFRASELAQFIENARERYNLGNSKVVAVGYSNGANIAAALMLQHPHHLHGAVLFRAMVPYKPETMRSLRGISVFLSAGRRDSIVPTANTRELAGLLESAGADVSLYWHPGGHELGEDDIEAAKQWLQQYLTGSPDMTRRTL
jgi:predicted esterase